MTRASWGLYGSSPTWVSLGDGRGTGALQSMGLGYQIGTDWGSGGMTEVHSQASMMSGSGSNLLSAEAGAQMPASWICLSVWTQCKRWFDASKMGTVMCRDWESKIVRKCPFVWDSSSSCEGEVSSIHFQEEEATKTVVGASTLGVMDAP
jgi:hypothetical protein